MIKGTIFSSNYMFSSISFRDVITYVGKNVVYCVNDISCYCVCIINISKIRIINICHYERWNYGVRYYPKSRYYHKELI